MSKAGAYKLTLGYGEAIGTVNSGTEGGALNDADKDRYKKQITAFYDYIATTRADTWNWGLIDPEMHEYIAARLPGYDRYDRDGFSEQLYAFVLRQIPLPETPTMKILEVGCGSGTGLNFLSRLEPVPTFVGLDLCAPSIEMATALLARTGRLSFLHGDAENLPLPEGEFDAVINVESSHSYPDFPKFLSEVARVLKRGGYLSLIDVFNKDRLALTERFVRETPGLKLLKTIDVTDKVRAAVIARMQPDSVFRKAQRKTAPPFLRALSERGQMLTHGAMLLRQGDFQWDWLTRMIIRTATKSAGNRAHPQYRAECYRYYLLTKQDS